MNGIYTIKEPINEPILSYLPASAERVELEEKLKEMRSQTIEIPLIINGQEVRKGTKKNIICPHDHKNILGSYYEAGEHEIALSLQAVRESKATWQALSFEQRSSIFLKAAELISTKYRSTINACTMLNQSKTVMQAEIDSACELIDFLRFNVKYLEEIYKDQPASTNDCYNRLEYRPLDGFVYAITPFNFTAIGGNLASAPALCGNTVVWKPSPSAILSNYYVMKIFMEAGLPAGVINFIPAPAEEISATMLAQKDLAGVHFTGSTKVFRGIFKQIAANIDLYTGYPRLVGETGGKDFVFAEESADVPALVTALIRGSFEYQGQKCSAASRAYIPASLWGEVKKGLEKQMATITMGDVQDFGNFMGAVIHQQSFNKCKEYIEHARNSDDAEVIMGGNCDDSRGYFVEPTVILAKQSGYRSMKEEIFGPVLSIYVYENDQLDHAISCCINDSPYALTGAIFSHDRLTIDALTQALVSAAGNFYINDKPTGAVVGQQPFGGGMASGTNDKAGSRLNLLRWLSPRTIKENFNPPVEYTYPYMK